MNTPISYDEIVKRAGCPVVAIVAGVGLHNGLAVVRGLGGAGIPVYAVSERDSLGFHSRYVRKAFVVPDNHRDPETVLQTMERIGKDLKAEGKKGVLIATRDSAVELFAKSQSRLSEHLICHFP